MRDNDAGLEMAYVDKLSMPLQRLYLVGEFPGGPRS
jgi:hypothetical protein